MALPSVVLKRDGLGTNLAGFLFRRISCQPLVHAQAIVLPTIKLQLSFQIGGIPKEQMIQVFPA